MKALILAAGEGRRMRPLTDDRPKPLLELAGKSLLQHAVELARALGATQTIVVTGYMPGAISSAASHLPDVQCLHNARYQDGALTSLAAGLAQIGHDALLSINSDYVFFDAFAAGASSAIAKARADAAKPARPQALIFGATLPSTEIAPDEMRIDHDPDGRITAMRKSTALPPFVYSGVFWLSPHAVDPLREAIRRASGDSEPVEAGLIELARQIDTRAVDLGARHWLEVDTPRELDEAETWLARLDTPQPLSARAHRID